MKKSGNTKSEKKLVYGAIITFLLAVAVFSSIKLTKVDAMNVLSINITQATRFSPVIH